MAKTKTSTTVKNRYNAKAYDRVGLMLPKGRKSTVEAHVSGNGESINGYVNRLIREDMGLSDEEWKRPADDGPGYVESCGGVQPAVPLLSPSDGPDADGK